jgi:hypothetical protein
MGSNTSPPNSGLKAAEREVVDLVVGTGAKAAVEPIRVAMRADFMVAVVFEERSKMILRRQDVDKGQTINDDTRVITALMLNDKLALLNCASTIQRYASK